MIQILTLILLLLVISQAPSYAQKESSNSTPSAKIKYDLAYPGILPDHPLYKLKVLRDKVATFLIRDPIKKAEYHLLLADKRIQMARSLVSKGKIELAKETALKGENEYTLLVSMFKDVRKKPTKDLFNRLEKAAMKHHELLSEIIARVDPQDKKTFKIILEFSKRNLEELKSILNE